MCYCCCPIGSDEPMVSTCEECGYPVDAEGNSGDVCEYSGVDCTTCGRAACEENC